MKLSEILRNEAAPIWDSYLVHPFITGIADGTLPIEKFRYYLIQDYLYLFDYSRVFALGVVKAPGADMMRFFADFMYSTLNGEMDIHKSYMARLGITQEEADGTKMALTNLSYTHYMLAVGQNEGIAELLISILSCAWSYEHIGKHLAAVPGALENEFYGEWIAGYSSDEYAAGNRRLIAMTDALGEGADTERLKEIFVNCSRYEAMFWDMAYNMGDR